jgi:hypothetical protein
MKQCVSQCSLGRVPHDCRHTTRIRQGRVYISREGRAYSPQIIIRRALQQEVLQILNMATVLPTPTPAPPPPYVSAAAVFPHVIERLTHPRESVRKKAVMALLHFHAMDPDRSGPLAGVF